MKTPPTCDRDFVSHCRSSFVAASTSNLSCLSRRLCSMTTSGPRARAHGVRFSGDRLAELERPRELLLGEREQRGRLDVQLLPLEHVDQLRLLLERK